MEAPRGDQGAELEATENPLHREAELPPAAYAVAGLPAGKSGVAFRVTPVLHDRVLNYPERLAEAPALVDGARPGTVWAAAEDTGAWIQTEENGLWLPKKFLRPVTAERDGVPGALADDSCARHDRRRRLGSAPTLVHRLRAQRRPGKASAEPSSTTSEPPALAPREEHEPEGHEVAAREQACRALALQIEGLEDVLPASRALFRPMGLANGRPRWCQPDDPELLRS